VGSALKRMILVLVVAVVASAMPAMAKNTRQGGGDPPPGPPSLSFGPSKNGGSSVDHGPEGSGVTHYGKNLSKPPTGGGC
jgi:hypothetical protein